MRCNDPDLTPTEQSHADQDWWTENRAGGYSTEKTKRNEFWVMIMKDGDSFHLLSFKPISGEIWVGDIEEMTEWFENEEEWAKEMNDMRSGDCAWIRPVWEDGETQYGTGYGDIFEISGYWDIADFQPIQEWDDRLNMEGAGI